MKNISFVIYKHELLTIPVINRNSPEAVWQRSRSFNGLSKEDCLVAPSCALTIVLESNVSFLKRYINIIAWENKNKNMKHLLKYFFQYWIYSLDSFKISSKNWNNKVRVDISVTKTYTIHILGYFLGLFTFSSFIMP